MKKIYCFLHSDDLEMVQLGAVLVQGSVHKSHWKRIMRRWLDGIPDSPGTHISYCNNWTWQITREGIEIKRVEPYTTAWGVSGSVGVSGIGTGATYTYTMPTITATCTGQGINTTGYLTTACCTAYGYSGSALTCSP